MVDVLQDAPMTAAPALSRREVRRQRRMRRTKGGRLMLTIETLVAENRAGQFGL